MTPNRQTHEQGNGCAIGNEVNTGFFVILVSVGFFNCQKCQARNEFVLIALVPEGRI